MVIKHKELTVTSNGKRATYVNITEDVKRFVEETKLENGVCVVSTSHTTCSVIFEEYVHDVDWHGDELIQVDLNRILDKIIPRQLTESDYLYPGPKHVEFLEEIAKDHPEFPADPATILNGDAHIRASIFGPEKTFILKDSKLLIGSVGYIYFIDWDQNRERNRKINIMIMGE